MTNRLYIAGTIIAIALIAALWAHSALRDGDIPAAVIGYSENKKGAVAAYCDAQQPHLMMLEIFLVDSPAEFGDAVRVIVGDTLHLFEAREGGVIGLAIAPELAPSILASDNGRLRISVVGWDKAVYVLDIDDKFVEQASRLICAATPDRV